MGHREILPHPQSSKTVFKALKQGLLNAVFFVTLL